LEKERLFFWGWLRLFVGTLQMASSVTAVLLIIQVGFEAATWAFIALSLAATAASHLLYRGRSDSQAEPAEH